VREAAEFFLVLSIIPSHQTAYLRSSAGKSSHAISLTNRRTMDKTLIRKLAAVSSGKQLRIVVESGRVVFQARY